MLKEKRRKHKSCEDSNKAMKKRLWDKIRDKRGVALIVVILMVSIIAAVSVELNRATRDDLYETANLSDRIRLYYVAKSGFYVGQALLVQDVNGYDALTEDWAKTELVSPQSEGYFRQGSFLLKIVDETGKIPINKLVAGNAYNPNLPVKDLLFRLLSLPEFKLDPGKVNEILASLKDWMDSDNEVTDGLGAENSYYQGLSRPVSVKNGILDCIDELLMVKGISEELYYGTKEIPALKDCLTIHGDGPININTAPPAVLRALATGITEEMAGRMEEYRRTAGNPLADVNWYKNVQGMGSMNLSNVVITSKYYTIISMGMFGRMKETITGTIERGPGTAKLLSWNIE